MHSIVIYLILLFELVYLISNPRKYIRININECTLEVKCILLVFIEFH